MNLETIFAPLKGLKLTLNAVMREPRVTEQYPEERPQVSTRYRGVHELRLTPDGRELCVGCSLCASACPADCILVEAGEEEEDSGKYLSPERFARVYKINMARCIFCGYCVDACPTYALGMTQVMQDFVTDDRWSEVWDKEKLIENHRRRLRQSEAGGYAGPQTDAL